MSHNRRAMIELWNEVLKHIPSEKSLTWQEQYKVSDAEQLSFTCWDLYNIEPIEIYELYKRNIPKLTDRDSKIWIDKNVDERDFPFITLRFDVYELFSWSAGKDTEQAFIESVYIMAIIDGPYTLDKKKKVY